MPGRHNSLPLRDRPKPQLHATPILKDSPTEHEYIPTDADFTPFVSDHSVITDPISDVLHDPTPPLIPPPPVLEEYAADPSTRTPYKARRRTTVSDLPALPAEDYPPDGLSRFDWRQRALSRTGRANGTRWFPGLERKRARAMAEELVEGDTFYEELNRYQNQ